MTATEAKPRLLPPAWLLAPLLAMAALLHGCHGDDVDHEPGVAPVRVDCKSPGRVNE